jgi:hypothetical protein
VNLLVTGCHEIFQGDFVKNCIYAWFSVISKSVMRRLYVYAVSKNNLLCYLITENFKERNIDTQ